MVPQGAIACLLLLWAGVAFPAAAATDEYGCDLAVEQPCRANASLCVALEYVNDGYLDCPDGSDEGCGEGWFVCEDRSACVAPDLLQDGVPDCYDESDEVCEEWQHECLCGFPRCIPFSSVGDGHSDCLEESDELSIDKSTYICPPEVSEEQELRRRRRKRQLEDQRPVEGLRRVLIGEEGPLGPITSTVNTFINSGTTSEYVTRVHGTRIDGHYTQLTSTSSRVFYALPTNLWDSRPEGLISSSLNTRVTDAATTLYTTRYLRTHIDGTYAQLIETASDIHSNPASLSTAPLSIPVQGTFFSQPSDGHSKAHVQVSLKDTALSPSSVADEVVMLTGTQGKFIKDGPSHATTFSVFTGTYVKDLRTYLFFFGNTILPPSPGMATPELITKTHTEVVVRKGGDQSKIMVDMNKDLEVIMPSKTQMMDSTKAPDLLMGEGVMDGRVMGGVFIEGSEGFDMEGTQMSESGKTSMLAVTITRPMSNTVTLQPSSTLPAEEVTVLTMADKLGLTHDVDNEIEGTLLRARKARISGGEIIADLRTSRPLEVNLPTYTVGHSNLPLEQVLGFSKNGGRTTETSVEKTVSEKHQESNQRAAKSVSDIRERFNLERGGEDSDLPTVTYVGFADFVTTIANTVVVFTPRSDTPNKIIKPSVSKTREAQPPTAFNPSPVGTPTSPTTLAPRLASSRHTEEDIIAGSPTDAFGLQPSVHHSGEKSKMEAQIVTPTSRTSLRGDQEEALVEDLPPPVFSTVSTKRYNTIDLYPTGLVSYIGGTIVRDDMRTLLTTYVYGTYIQGQYAQVVQSTSSIFYLVSRSTLPDVQVTPPVQPVAATHSPQAPELTTEFSDIYDYDYEGSTTELGPVEDIVDNALGRSVGSNPDQQLIVDTADEKPVSEEPEPATPQPPEESSEDFTTLTYYTTYFTDGVTSVATRYETSSVFLPFFGLQDTTTESDPTPVDEELEPTQVSPVHLTTYTYYTTLFVDGSTQVSSRIEVLTKETDDTSSSLTPSFLAPTPTVAPVQPLLTTTLSTTTALPGTTEDTTESPAVEEDLAVIEAISVDEPAPTTESFIESMSESMSESSTDSSGQDVTEGPKAALESSLNPEDEVNAAFFPRTYYTTYTYFTTYYRAGSSSIVSSLETLTNVVTDPSDHDQHQTLTPVVPTYPVTYYTTYTYWTTFFKGTSTISTSSEKTLSNVVTPAVKETATPVAHGEPIPVMDASPTSATSPAATTATITAVTPTPAVTTFYTTYTYYTSTYVGDKTIVNSRLETITNVVSSSFLPGGVRPPVTLDNVFGFGTTTTAAITPSSGVTLPLNLFGFDETTASKSEATLPLDLFGFGVTTTSSLEETRPQFPTKTKSTGLISTIRGSTVVDGTTTIFSTNIIGTVVDGLYAQIQSTTSIVIPPTSGVVPIFEDRDASPTLPSFFLPTTAISDDSHATIDPASGIGREAEVEVPAVFATPTLESSLQAEVTDTTPQDEATEALPSEATTEESEKASPTSVSNPKSKPTSRNNFPVRPSGSRRRPDFLPFLRRTNFRSATITRDGLTPTVTATPADAAGDDDDDTASVNRPFRFGFLDITTDTTTTDTDTDTDTTTTDTDTDTTTTTTTSRDSAAPSSVRFRFQSSKPGGPRSSSRPGLFGPSSVRGSSPGFRFGASSPGAFPGASSPGGFRFGGTRSSVFPGSTRSVKPTSVFPTLATTAAPDSDLDPLEEETLLEEPEIEEEVSDTDAPSVNFRPFSFRPRKAPSNDPHTRASVPFSLLNRRPDVPPTRRESTPSRFSPAPKKSVANNPEDALDKKRTTTPRPTPSQRLNRLSPEERRRNRIRQSRPDLSKLFARRNPLNKDLDNEATDVDLVYIDPTGGFVEDAEVALVRKKRQTTPFGMRMTSRGATRVSRARSRDSLPLPPPASSRFSRQRPAATPVESEDTSQQFTLRSGTRPGRGRTPAATPATPATPAPPAPAPPPTPNRRATAARQAQRATRPSTSRTTLPARPRGPSRTRDTVPLGNIPGRGLRRPATDNNFRTSSKFAPRTPTGPVRRPPVRRTTNTNTDTNRKRLQTTTNSNPIKEFRNRPAPPVTTEPPPIFPSDDGSFLIQDELTVTREVPVKATIPLIEDGETIMKEVITASYKTEVLQPDQITQTEIDGSIRLFLSSVESEKMVTKYVINPVNTTTVTHTPTFVSGRRTSTAVILPTTAYSIVTITQTKGAGGEIQQLLQLLLGQQQQPQNPFLAAFGLGGQQTPRYITHTNTFVTTVTNVVSTAIPIIFRGKPVHTTLVESQIEVVTATEFSTETVLAAHTALPFGNPAPINPLLPLLFQGQLQQQTAQNRPSREPSKADPLLLEQLLKQKRKEIKLKQSEFRQPSPPTPEPVQTSVVTMYVSGRRPGEFSTVLSTVFLSGEGTRRKRGSYKTRGAEATVLPHFIETDKGLFELPDAYSEDDVDWFVMSAMNEIDVSGVTKVTPALDSILGDLAQDYYQTVAPRNNGTHSFNTSPFLWAGPAEFAPLKRNVRSAQRGNIGEPKARKIEDGTLQQIVADDDEKRLSLGPLEVAGDLSPEQVLAPTTYYTTFTYYTTLVDDAGNEFIQSSEETLTQLATNGNVVLDDFTKTPQEEEEDIVQEKFTLEDAIVPGKPRPVPDPVFTEPPPPFGPVIRHRLPDPDFDSEPNPPPSPPRGSGQRRRVPGGNRLESSFLESELPELQRPRRIVLTRKRPVVQSPESHIRTVVTRRRPVNQLDDSPASSVVESTPEEALHLEIEREHLIEDFQKLNPSVDDVSTRPTHEVMEIEEQDREEEVAGQPGNSRRVRVTVTNRRAVQLTRTAEADKTMTLSGGRRRVVVTRRLPQPTVVASPLRPVVATVSTYYTIYSYLYSLYERNDLVSVSTREVTVSNEVEPTAVSVLPTFQTGMTASGLYTVETGSTVATLGERVFQSLTTQIFLSSATLINLTPEAIKENAQTPQTSEASHPPSSVPGILQSSLAEDDVVLSTDTPFITTSSFRATRERSQKTSEKQLPDSTPLTHHDVTTVPESLTPSRGGVRGGGRGTVRFAFTRPKVKVTVTRRRPVASGTREPAPAATPAREVSPAIAPTRQFTPTHQFSPGLTPTRQLSPGFTPTRQLTPTHHLSPGFSPIRHLSPGFSPTRQLSPGFTPTRQLTPTRQTSPALIPTGQASPALTPTRQTSPALTPTRQTSPAFIPTGQASPALIHTGQTSPALIHAGQASPALIHTGQISPALIPTGQASPPLIHTGQTSPALIPIEQASPALIHTGQTSPALIPTGQASPVLIHTGQTSPALIHTGQASPTLTPTRQTSPALTPVRQLSSVLTQDTPEDFSVARIPTESEVEVPAEFDLEDPEFFEDEVSPPSERPSTGSRFRFSQERTSPAPPVEDDSFILTPTEGPIVEEEAEVTTTPKQPVTPVPTPVRPTRPPRSSIRRDDIPIIRRPSRPSRPFVRQQVTPETTPATDPRLRFTPTPLPKSEPSEAPPKSEPTLPSPTTEPSELSLKSEPSEAPPKDTVEQPADDEYLYEDYDNDYYYYDEEGESPGVLVPEQELPHPEEQPSQPEVQPPRQSPPQLALPESGPSFLGPSITETPTSTLDILAPGVTREPDTALDADQTEAPAIPPPGLVYTTFATTTLLPILGGERSITLTIMTSSLTTPSITLPFFNTVSPSLNEHSPTTPTVLPSPSALPPSLEPSSPPGDDTQTPVVVDPLPEVTSPTAPAHPESSFAFGIFPDSPVADSGDKTALPLPQDQIVSSNLEKFRRPITLPPSTLSDEMLLFASPETETPKVTQLAGGDDGTYQTNTYFTTYTYYNTLLAGNKPFVITSKQTLENVVTVPLPHTGNFIEHTEVTFETHTYYKTQTFTRTIEEEESQSVITSHDVLTQVVITEAPSVDRTSVTPSQASLVTKTYFTTLTYYNTAVEAGTTVISSNTVVSSEVVTETAYITKTPSLDLGEYGLSPTSISLPAGLATTQQDDLILYATKTVYTTLTYLTTILEGSDTITTSSIDISSSVITEPVTTALSHEELNSLRESFLADQVTPTALGEAQPHTVSYIKIRDNVYKQLRTLFATYTHFTTLHNGEVQSRLETKTKILTSTVTTSSVAASLLITPTGLADLPVFGASTVAPGVESSAPVQLDPSYLSSLKSSYLALKPTSLGGPGEEEGLQATVVVEGHDSGTFVVSDSTTSATLLVGPTDEVSTSVTTGQTIVIFDPEHLSSLKSSYQASIASATPVTTPTPTSLVTPEGPSSGTPIFVSGEPEETDPTPDPVTLTSPDAITPTSPDPVTPTSPDAITPTSPDAVTPTSPDAITPTSPDTPVSPVTSPETVPSSSESTSPDPEEVTSPDGSAVTTEDGSPVVVSPTPAAVPSPAPAPAPAVSVQGGSTGVPPVSSGGISPGEYSLTGSSDNALNIDLGPMLTAVAGLLRNNLNGQSISAKSDGEANDRRKISPPLRPTNTLISPQREPLLIPVGGVGASLSSTRSHTLGPEQGFIPLKRPDGSTPQSQPRFPGQAPALEVPHNQGFIKIQPGRPRPAFSAPTSIEDMEGFGPTFLPPQTQAGFTAMTDDNIASTRVAVIAGSPTIFIGGVALHDLPPPGQPAPPGSHGQNVDRSTVTIHPSQTIPEGQTRPMPIPVRVPLPGDGGPIPLPVLPEGFPDQEASDDTHLDLVSSRPNPHRPQPSLVGPQTIVSIEGDNRIVGTQVIHGHPTTQRLPEPPIIVSPAGGEYVLHSTVGVGIISGEPDDERPLPPPGVRTTVISGAETVLLGHGVNRGLTTVVRGSSTVMSGATTIFGSLFTRPASSTEQEAELTSIVSGPRGVPTRFITRVETIPRTVTATHTEFVYTGGVTSTLTQVVYSTLPPRTIVSTIVGTATRVNYVTVTITPDGTAVTSGLHGDDDSTTYPPGSPFDPANYPSFPLNPDPHEEELRLPGDAEVVLSEDTLGIAEDNEISKVVESKSPDQEISLGGPLRAPVSLCEPQCSAARYEVCRLIRGEHTCVCRSGYSRRNEYDACKPSLAYNVQVLLDHMSDGQLIFDAVLHNASHPITQDLSDITTHGINQAMRESPLGPRYHTATITKFSDTKEMVMPASVNDMEHGLVADIKVEFLRDTEEAEESDLDEARVRQALDSVLRSSNYSLGGTGLFTSRAEAVLASEDFNECIFEDHNDCSINANCFNTPGSYLCACRDGFKDISDLPGRECAVQTERCAQCNFQGECVIESDGSVGCQCLQWFSGNRCQLNLRVMLIALVTVGSLLILLLLLCLALCCMRARRNTRDKLAQVPGAPTFLRARSTDMSGTLDRRAMINETSSESSVEHPRHHNHHHHHHAASFMTPSSSEKAERVVRAPRSEISTSRRSQSSFAEDRSMGVHTTLPPVLIPRVKGPAPPRPSVVGRDKDGEARVMIGADARSDLASSQQAFVDLLDPPGPAVCRSSRRESMTAASIHSSARINRSRSHSRERLSDAFLHQLHPQGSTRSRSTDRLHNSTHDLNSEFGVNFSFRGDGERTMSEARSYDETTVRPPIRSLRAESFYSSKALSSQHISEHQTMAERDGGSTVVYPQTELYRPVRDNDSISDMSEQHSKVTSSRGASRNFFS
ncbi:uncharacterized protein LOC127010435 isoform X2 [Eriocheir sinensis]|uniref:uncharacterized protein LOC127010435 isoform X2 n=1 Tax=Eriocheir sinensis TaxID=95602 RepID=UPI0021C96C92|nr:uncharacterized protein LOC127010435 isoform X2 [Eriocheir sinensis]